MYYLYPLDKLKICLQSESHKNITKSKQIRKFFVSPVKFTKVHVRGFDNEPTIWALTQENLSSGFGNNKVADKPEHLCRLISAFVICFLVRIIFKLATSKFQFSASFCS